MAKANKKSAKETSSIFHNIMAASVKGISKQNWISIKEKTPDIDQKILVKYIGTPELTDTYIFKEYDPSIRPKVSVLPIANYLDGKKTIILIDDNILWKAAP